jgi:GNAT superfamily N-acetyltransferase
MSSIEVRPFRRGDRDQLTSLVNAHVAAVVPGMGVSDDRVSPSYRGTGEIRWLLFWPEGPASANAYWTDATRAAEKLIGACVRQLEQWGVTSMEAGGELPAPGVYGVPEQWPHIRALYQRAGFRHDGHTEAVYLIRVEDMPGPAGPPLDGLRIRRSVGLSGTRLSAVSGPVQDGAGEGEVTGFIEVDILDEGERLPRHGRWADIGNLHVQERYRRRGVATWLLRADVAERAARLVTSG